MHAHTIARLVLGLALASAILLARTASNAQVFQKEMVMTTAPYSSAAVYRPGPFATATPSASDVDPILADELTLRAAGLSTDGPSLLVFFRARTLATVPSQRPAALVQKLGDPDAAAREKAVGELVCLGSHSLPALRRAVNDVDDGERVSNARRCLQALEGPAAAALPAAAARLLALRRPEGAAGVLLAYLPLAPDESVIEEVRTTLTGLAYRDGRPDPSLVQALADASSLRRTVSAEALCQARGGPLPPAVRRLLQDDKPLVRLRAALALADHKDGEAVTALIALLGQLPPAQARQAEDYLFALAEDQAPKSMLGNDAASRQKVQDEWTNWWQARDGAALLGELRRRSLTVVDREKVQKLIQQMDDDTFGLREKAKRDLVALGPVVIPMLRPAMTAPELEIRQGAKWALNQINDSVVPLSLVTVRLLAYRKPAGAAEALLNYLPFAEEEPAVNEVKEALVDVAFKDGRPEPAVLKALQDKMPKIRIAAAEALCWAGTDAHRARVRELLRDGDPAVRLRVALALTAAGEREAVPVLIALLGELPLEQAMLAEEALQRLAGTKAPDEAVGADADSRRKSRDAWAAWWRQSGPKVELARSVRPVGLQRHLGYTLLVVQNMSQIQEYDRSGKLRWQLTGVQMPYDAQVLPGNRILVAEYNGRRVTERNFKGDILWQKEAQWPVGCQRLGNGNTLIVMRNQLVEVDRAGKEVFTFQRNNYDITAAHKLRDGRYVFVTMTQRCVWLDAAGKEAKSFAIGNTTMPCSVQVLPNGNVVIPLQYSNKVVEYDGDGKTVWEATVQQPCSAMRLYNGNTLVCSHQYPSRVFEVDKAGKVVWEHKSGNQVSQVSKALRR